MSVIMGVEIGILAVWWLRKLGQYDKSCGFCLTRAWYCFMIGCSMAMGYMAANHSWQNMQGETWLRGICQGIFGAYLLAVSVTDMQTYESYDCLYWVGSGAGFLVLLDSGQLSGVGLDLVIFFCLQRFLFCRMYGKADAQAFFASALFLGAQGGGMESYLLHMAASVALLAVVQGIRCNINVRGNLKRPVAFLPYISVTGWLLLCSG